MQINKIALLIGPSGSGKTTLANYLDGQYGMTQIASYTTRPPRFEGEPGHVFVTDDEFDQLQELVAYTDFGGYRYCATAQQVEEADIYVVDVAGAEYFKEAYKGSKKPVVFYISVPNEIRRKRMEIRGDGVLTIAQRIDTDRTMFANAVGRLQKLYDEVYEIGNDDVVRTAEEIYSCLNEGDDTTCL